MPGCGKTHDCRAELSGHVRVSQDEGPRGFAALLRHYERLLAMGIERIAIDRTNPLRAQRHEFARRARAAGLRARIVRFDVPKDVCRDRIRRRTDHPTLGPDQMEEAIRACERRVETPTAEECDERAVWRGS
jgi:predicted kinase